MDSEFRRILENRKESINIFRDFLIDREYYKEASDLIDGMVEND